MTKNYVIKDSYNDLQIDDVNRYNNAINDLNNLYNILDELVWGTQINQMNNKIKLQKEHLKRIKPNWLKR